MRYLKLILIAIAPYFAGALISFDILWMLKMGQWESFERVLLMMFIVYYVIMFFLIKDDIE